MVEPLVRGEADAVFGSRMMEKGAARRGGMPAYKFVGNKILTRVENKLLGSDLSEFHSGYRAYNVHTLSELDLSATSNGFNFDTQIIIALHSHGKKIVEIPIPTYYGDEICYVNGMQYAADVVADVAVYRLAKMGFTPGELAQVGDEYELKESEGSSHTRDPRPDGRLPAVQDPRRRLLRRPARPSCSATAATMSPASTPARSPDVEKRVDEFFQADLEQGIPEEAGAGYDLADGRRRPRAPAQLRPAAARDGQPARRGRPGHHLGSQLRPLVPAGPHRAGHLRLRPARHPRQDPRPVLHPAQPAADDQEERLHREADGDDRAPGRRRLRQAVPGQAAGRWPSTRCWSGCGRRCSPTSSWSRSSRCRRRAPSCGRARNADESGPSRELPRAVFLGVALAASAPALVLSRRRLPLLGRLLLPRARPGTPTSIWAT